MALAQGREVHDARRLLMLQDHVFLFIDSFSFSYDTRSRASPVGY